MMNSTSLPVGDSYLQEHDSTLSRWQGQNCLEIWGEDIGEHFLITFDENKPHLMDVTFIQTERDPLLR
jgi:hypothetical protein